MHRNSIEVDYLYSVLHYAYLSKRCLSTFLYLKQLQCLFFVDTSGWQQQRLATKLVVLAQRAVRWNVLDYLTSTQAPAIWRTLDLVPPLQPQQPPPDLKEGQEASSLRSALGHKLKLPGGAEVELNAFELHALDPVRSSKYADVLCKFIQYTVANCLFINSCLCLCCTRR